MKQLMLVIFFLGCGTTLFYGQKYKIETGLNPQVTALFVNSVYVGNFESFCINSNEIDSIKVVREPIEIDGKSFKNQIHFFSSSQFKFISLQELLDNYRDKNKPLYSPIFIINETILTNNNVFSCKVDENYLLKVKCTNSDELGYWSGKESFTIVSILTKTPENIKRYEVSASSKYFGARDSVKLIERNRELQEYFIKKHEEEKLKNKTNSEK